MLFEAKINSMDQEILLFAKKSDFPSKSVKATFKSKLYIIFTWP